MQACVVLFLGSNADREMVRTLHQVYEKSPTIVGHTEISLPPGTDLVVIPGGFSYGDYLRCGAMAKASPIIPAILRHAEEGRYILGVCNGFQILTEIGLLPGALTRNVGLHFQCRDCFVKVTAAGPFTSDVGVVWRLPIAHAEGRYQASEDVYEQLKKEGRIALRYCTSEGAIEEAANPNGSLDAIAGVYGGTNKNVLGLMPHPERISEPLLGGVDGRALFVNLLSSVEHMP
ncbi:phosphoribosylformylglycinamidine synthase subunit PurQ [Pajaroellobacter abortibovis]|uniref:Phosphoribosylformylglycinamidine synthase subunit PurQ n=1 Tax=Pajaroellobacter abortibovis TaxID=1882918 RepID=A0A1L6MXZ4_9BACT|nr:phosphoribosylformylglycinamidine synthase subunit PurQ [Pajaroellobacter abortibovis]APS00481.1 phosphoribosylformylglycinamidine synthase I [Pajaroellobacter abortibovis]